LATERVLIQVAGFLRRELPVRLAHRIRDLDTVTFFHDILSAIKVKEVYTQSFLDLVDFLASISSQDDEERHISPIVVMIAVSVPT